MVFYMNAEQSRFRSQEALDRNSPLTKLMEIVVYNINRACEKGEFECDVVYPRVYSEAVEDVTHKLRIDGYTVKEVMDGNLKISW